MLEKHDILQQIHEKQIDRKWDFAEYKPSQTSKWTHGYHRYPAKFVPQLVEKLIAEYVSDTHAHINDPFMGSGTTIVTAISKGFKASGTDINKIAHLITKVKAKPIEPAYLENKIREFLSRLSFLNESKPSLFREGFRPTIPDKHIERINYWFSDEHKNKLGTILTVISDEEDETLKDFFLVAFSNILKNCSIWSKGSTKPTRDFKKSPTNPYSAIRRHLTKMQRGNSQFYHVVPCPDTCKVLAVISSKVTLRERIAQTGYWKLKLLSDETTRHIKVYLISPDEDGTLTKDYNPPKKAKAIIETDLDGSYILTEAELGESEKVKPFRYFIEDLKAVLSNFEEE